MRKRHFTFTRPGPTVTAHIHRTGSNRVADQSDNEQVLTRYVAALQRSGRPYENECIGVFTVRDGKIQSVREYMDTLYAHERAFAAAAR
jgi:ketosteroid isomerase-like protein